MTASEIPGNAAPEHSALALPGTPPMRSGGLRTNGRSVGCATILQVRAYTQVEGEVGASPAPVPAAAEYVVHVPKHGATNVQCAGRLARQGG
jgi:hypothetical protein